LVCQCILCKIKSLEERVKIPQSLERQKEDRDEYRKIRVELDKHLPANNSPWSLTNAIRMTILNWIYGYEDNFELAEIAEKETKKRANYVG